MKIPSFPSAAAHPVIRRGLCAIRRSAVAAGLLIAPAAFALVGATPSVPVLQFPATAVGSTNTMTMTFAITGYNSYPGIAYHYNTDYTTSAETCDGLTPTETCTLTVKFTPTLPGARKDAIFVTYNGSRLATVLLAGVGNAPLGALQPGVTSTVFSSSSISVFAPVVDENGTTYFLNYHTNQIVKCTTGCSTPVAIVNNAASGTSPFFYNMSIDGAGVLYWGQGYQSTTAGNTVNTYDTVQNIQGTITFPASATDIYGTTGVDGVGDIFALGIQNQDIYKLSPSGTLSTTAITPAVPSDYIGGNDQYGNFFIGGLGTGLIDELAVAGTISQVSTRTGINSSLAFDAAGTMYSGVQSGGVPSPAESPVANYNSIAYTLPNPYYQSLALASNGNLQLGFSSLLETVDRTQNPLAFGSQTIGVAAATQTVNVINIGDLPLTYTNIAISGTGFALQTAAANPCTPGITLAAGASCNLAVNFNGPYAGSFTGSVVMTSNSLNNASSTQTIALTAAIHGPYLTASQTSVTFPNQTIATTSSEIYVTITNGGIDPTVGLTITSSNPAFTIGTSSANIPECSEGENLPSPVQSSYYSCRVAIQFSPTLTQNYTGTITITGGGGAYASSTTTIAVSGNGAPVVTQTAGGAGNVITFNNAAVGVAQASAQTVTASFLITGLTSLVTPTASLRYGTSYTAGAATCIGSIGAQTCSVPVTFTPTLPGGRRDALFLTAGGVRIATALVYGIGTAPLALLQPGVITQPVATGGYYYGSIVGEDGTVYVLETESNSVLAVTKAGVATTLPITQLNSPREIAIDGAGILYIADQTAHGVITTYDTLLGIQGSVPFQSTEFYNQGVAIGNTGNMYLTDSLNIYTVPLTGSGTAKTTAVNPANTQNTDLIVDSSENVFDQGYAINELTPAGVQTQPNTTAGNNGLAVDAAGTLYSGRYGSGGIGELAASNYAAAVGYVDGSAGVEGVSVAPDGTVYGGDYNSVDKVDRSQGFFTFNSVNANQAAIPQVATIYNGGNTPLTLTSLTLTGDPNYTLTANGCTNGLVIPVGGICSVTVNFTAPRNGIFTGALTFVTNSLNTTATTQTIGLTDTVTGAYLTATPTTLNFGTVPLNTPSAPQTIMVTNTGGSPGTIQASDNNGRFAITTPSACTSLAIGASCQLSVVFTPTASGLLSTTGNISATSTGNYSNNIALSFTGAGGPAPTPAVTLSPTSLSFNPPINTTSAPQVVQLTNSGNASLSLTNLYVVTGNASFSLAPTQTANPCAFNTVLAAGASCNIAVTFTTFDPTSPGPYTGSITINDNAANQPQTITLSGTFTATPQLQFNPTQLTAIAGTGTVTTSGSGDGGTALAATFNQPFGIAQDASGNTYVSDYGANYVRKITPNGTISQYAGVVGYSNHGFSGDTGPATAAQLNGPQGLAVDASGNLYIADEYNGRVRVVNASTGVISTYAGTGVGSYTAGANALSTKLPGPVGLAFDPGGNLYISMGQNASIVVKVAPSGVTSLYAGVITSGAPVSGYNGDNIVANTAELNIPDGIATDQAGNLYIADQGNSRVRKVSASGGYISTFAGTGVDSSTGDGNIPSLATVNPFNVAVDLAGDVYIAGANAALTSFTVRKVSGGLINTLVGGGTGGLGGPSTSANLNYALQGIAIDNNGSLLIATNSPAQVLLAGPTGISQFPSQVVNTTSNVQNVFFENTGNANLTLGGTGYTATGPFAVAGGSCFYATTLSSSNTCSLAVTFTPTATGAATGSITFPSNGTIPSQTILLQGTGTPGATAQESLNPTSLTFANTAVNTTTAAQTIVLSNGGSATLTGIAISITGTGAADFAQTNNCLSTLAAGANCSIMVTFTPLSAATFSGTVTVTSALGSVTAPVSGTGTAPQASISGALTFPSTAVNATASAQTVTLTNNGNAPLPITSATIPNTQFAITANTCGTSLAASSACTYSITFTPTATGAQTSVLSVVDSVGTQTVSLSGTGTGTPAISYSPTSLTFNAAVNTTATAQLITVTNTGTAALTGPTASTSGASGFYFNISSTTCTGTLAVNASCTISVTFSPSSATTVTAGISLVDNAANSPQSVSLTGTGTAPGASAGPTSLSFSSTPVGTTSAAQMVTLTNSGSAALAITSATASPQFVISANTCGSSLGANSSCTYSVTFTPTAAGAQTGTLTIVDAVGTQTVSLSGTGTAPQAALTASLTFPSTNVGATAAAMSLTLTNAGNAALPITNTAFSGTQFALTTNTCNASLAANSTCSYTFTFTPSAAGTQTTTFTVTDSVGTQTATLTGVGVAPQAALTATLAFPSTVINTTATAMTATLSNSGNVALPITSASVSGTQFTLTSNTCGTSLAAGGSCTYSITFTPTALGAQTATLSVVDSVGTQTTALTGTGAPVPAAQAVLTPTSLTFPSSSIATTSAVQTITLSNPGTAALTITGITLIGANPADFAQTNTCGASLAVTANCTISVTFTPVSAATFTATINVADSASGSPQTATLTGSGSAFTDFGVAAPTNTQSVDPGGAAVYPINVTTLTGNFSTPVTLSASGLPTGATASFAPATVTPGLSGAPSVLTIQTSPSFAGLLRPNTAWAALLLFPLLGLRRLRRKLPPAARLLALALLSIAALLPLSGCGGGYFGAAPSAYTITVTGTSVTATGTVTHSTTVSLNLQ